MSEIEAGGPVDCDVGRRPWWWRLNPWRALANRERAYADALECLQDVAGELHRMRTERDALRTALRRIAKYPLTRAEELSTTGLREIAREALTPNAEVSGCLRAPMPEDAPRTAAGSPLDRPVGPVAGA